MKRWLAVFGFIGLLAFGGAATGGGISIPSYFTLGSTLVTLGTTVASISGLTLSTPNITGITGAIKAGSPITQAACADLSNAAASCSTDATNATNISSGTLASGRYLGAWSTGSNPTITCGSGSVTTVTRSWKYQTFNKTTHLHIDATLTNINTCASSIAFTLPNSLVATNGGVCAGRETATTGSLLQGSIAASGTTMSVWKYDNTAMITNGYVYSIDCNIETN